MTANLILEIIVLLLFIATVVGLISRRSRLPYTVGLVLMGLILSYITRPGVNELPPVLAHLIETVEAGVTRELIIGVFVTPLIFEAAFHLRWDILRRDLNLILALAIPGVLLTMIMVAGMISMGTGLPVTVTLVFGALISATDPVSVVSLFKTLGVPKRLQVLLEGESLFNDGTAVVVFSLALAIALGETTSSNSGGWAHYFINFVTVTGGGLLVGFILGWAVSQLIAMIDDHLIETTIITVLAFGAYLVAEQLQVSGVLAVVTAGLVNGNIGPKGMSPTSRIVVTNFWEYIAFLANSALFLLIGLETDINQLFLQWQPILLAIIAVLIARAVVIYFLTFVIRDIPVRWGHILLWGGLRGAVSLALALSLPLSLGTPVVIQIRTMAFGVVLFTILVQGFSMQPLVKLLHIIERSQYQLEYERRHARAIAARTAYDHLNLMHQRGLFSHHTWQMVSPVLLQYSNTLSGAVKDVIQADPVIEAEELNSARHEALRAQRSALTSLWTDGVISEEVFFELVREVDVAMTGSTENWAGSLMPSPIKPIKHLMTAIIQIQDYEATVNALTSAGLSLTQLSSSGGFLGRRNITLMIGLGENQEETAVRLLSQHCHRRVEYIATPLEGAPLSLPLSTPVTVGGATIFTLDVERFEEI